MTDFLVLAGRSWNVFGFKPCPPSDRWAILGFQTCCRRIHWIPKGPRCEGIDPEKSVTLEAPQSDRFLVPGRAPLDLFRVQTVPSKGALERFVLQNVLSEGPLDFKRSPM